MLPRTAWLKITSAEEIAVAPLVVDRGNETRQTRRLKEVPANIWTAHVLRARLFLTNALMQEQIMVTKALGRIRPLAIHDTPRFRIIVHKDGRLRYVPRLVAHHYHM